MSKLVGGATIHAVGVIAHTAIYAALMMALVPDPVHPATWGLCLAIAAVLAWTWPLTDYILTAALAIVSVICASCLVVAVLATCWLAARITEEEE